MQFPKTIRLSHEAYANQEAAFHVVVGTLPGERPFEDESLGNAVWTVIEGELGRSAVHLSAACLLPDHLHVIVSPRAKSIIRWMNDFKSYTTQISKGFRPQRVLWQPSFYDRRIRGTAEFENVLAYVVRNPMSAGLVSEEFEWPWVASWAE